MKGVLIYAVMIVSYFDKEQELWRKEGTYP
jgi:hypothetical protein